MIYCATLGIGFARWSARTSETVEIPPPQHIMAVAGIIVALWAGMVLWMLISLRIGTPLRLVMGVNILATLLVAACSMTAGTILAAAAVLAVAVDIAVFAVSQASALRALSSARTT